MPRDAGLSSQTSRSFSPIIVPLCDQRLRQALALLLEALQHGHLSGQVASLLIIYTHLIQCPRRMLQTTHDPCCVNLLGVHGIRHKHVAASLAYNINANILILSSPGTPIHRFVSTTSARRLTFPVSIDLWDLIRMIQRY